jgi:nucleotide-binding universal stress UspA family protein
MSAVVAEKAQREFGSACAAASETRTPSSTVDFQALGEVPGNGRLQHLLVAHDFSEAANDAIELATALAQRTQSTITLLHVVDSNPPSAARYAGSADSLMTGLWQTALARMLQAKDALAQRGIQADTMVVEGLPWEQIANFSSGFDLLVLGKVSNPRWRLFSKRTSPRILQQVSCPILIARKNQC